MKESLYLVDGYALIFRAYFAHIRSPLSNSDGFNVSAIHGFTRMLLSIIREYEPECLAVCLDSRTPTFRDAMYAEYKQTRNKTPEDLRAQFPVIEELLKYLHLPTIRHNGVEADDIIATLARRSVREGRKCFIVSGDKDLYQLVGEGVYILKPAKFGGLEELDEEGVFADKGVRPDQIVDYLSLLGDTADNVPGVRGVGQKTAEKLLAQFGDLDGMYANLDAVENANWRKKLEAGEESARFSKSLVILKDDVELDLSIENLNLNNLNGPRAAELLAQYQMKTLSADVEKLKGSTSGAMLPFYGMEEIEGQEVDPGGAGFVDGGSPREGGASGAAGEPGSDAGAGGAGGEGLRAELTGLEPCYELLRSSAELEAWIGECRRAGAYAFDTETDNLDPLKASLVGFSLSHSAGRACYVPLNSPEHKEGQAALLGEEEALALLRPLLEDASVRLIGQNIKYDYKVMFCKGIVMAKPWFDTLIAAWLLDTTQNAYSLDALAEQYLAYYTQKLLPLYEEIIGRRITKSVADSIDFSRIPLNKALFYAAEDADITFRLYRLFEKKLESIMSESGKPLSDLFFQLEMPLIPILSAMECEGIALNSAELSSYSEELGRSLTGIKNEIYELCGHEFNIASTKQLQVVLFEERQLKPGKKTKTGYSTDTSVLEELAREDRVPELVLRYRLLAKLKSTYVDALPQLLNPRTGRIHSRFQQNGTATGRISSHDPNLQNIPIRDEEGRRIRAAFVPRKGYRFISADYSQIELMVLAHLSQDKELLRAFREGIDVHSLTAGLIFHCSPEEVSSLQRRIAKTINFGVMYGMSAFRLAREIGISRSEAQQFIDAYFDTYSGIRSFMQSVVTKTEERGYVETMLGRRRPIPAIKSSNHHEKMGAERVAVNTPIQGSAADIVKRAMIKMAAALREGSFRAKMLLQVHDELIFEAPNDEVERLKKLLADVMPHALELSLSLRVNIEVGDSWGEMH